ncbi:MAG: WG repeat-containing protein [Caldimonas sp.]
MKRIVAVLALLLLLSRLSAIAQEVPRDACAVDPDLPSVPSCALKTGHGQRHVIARYVPLLFAATRRRLVAVRLPTGWAYIDRHGLIVVDDVAVMDNGANDFHQGLVRVTRNGKWGLADTHGRQVVPLTYDGMLDYQIGKGWKVCTGCRAASDGEHGWFEGGKWDLLDRIGRPVRQNHPGKSPRPVIGDACSGHVTGPACSHGPLGLCVRGHDVLRLRIDGCNGQQGVMVQVFPRTSSSRVSARNRTRHRQTNVSRADLRAIQNFNARLPSAMPSTLERKRS